MGKEMDKEWFPSLEEYNPRITKEQWTSFVQDKNIFDENSRVSRFANYCRKVVARTL